MQVNLSFNIPEGILIEGPNGSGKSTLAKKLSLMCNKPIMHSGPDDKTLLSTLKSVYNQISHLRKGGILDRCTPVSKQIYQKSTKTWLKLFLNLIYKVFYERHIVILCLGRGSVVDKEYYEKDHYSKITSERKEIFMKYEKFYSNKKCIKSTF